MLDIDKFTLKKISEAKNQAQIEISPLPRGFGQTVGNSLRRILLSSIEGAAIVSATINGVEHEYSTLDGVQDDVLEILMRLEQLALVSHTDDEVTLRLTKKGEKKGSIDVLASDFEPNPDVEIINKDLVITTLNDDKTIFDLEVKVKRGVGYAFPDEGRRREIGNIPLSANFNPVLRVEFKVEQARVGKRVDLDKILMTIITNGAKSPMDALLEAVEIYDRIANRLVFIAGGDPEELEEQQMQEAEKEEEQEEEEEKILISEINMSTRLINALMNAGIATLNELTEKTADDVINFKGMGKKSFEELKEILADFGLTFKDE